MNTPRWNALPPENQRRLPHKVVVPTDKPLRGIITCEMFVGVDTHWNGNATVPCMEGACRLCESGDSIRWYGFISVWDPKTGGHISVRITSGVAETFEDYIRNWKTLRGSVCSLERAKKSVKSKMVAKLAPNKTHSPEVIPAALDVHAILAHMWKLDKVTDPAERADMLQATRMAIAASEARLAKLRDPKREAAPPPIDDDEFVDGDEIHSKNGHSTNGHAVLPR